MDINFQTDKLVIIKYPTLAGGKFLSLCLAIHPDILHQDQWMAKTKMQKDFDQKKSLEMSKIPFSKKLKDGNTHYEFGCWQLAGFGAPALTVDIKADEKTANELWTELTNQNRYHFCMVEHTDEAIAWTRYPNRKTIILRNFEWIMEKRNKKCSEVWYNNLKEENYKNRINFDMSLLQNDKAFLQEIEQVFDFLGLDKVEDLYLLELRNSFLETLTIGFNIGEKL